MALVTIDGKQYHQGLDHVVAGTRLPVWGRYGNGGRVRTVIRTTRTQLIMDDGTRFWRRNGEEVGASGKDHRQTIASAYLRGHWGLYDTAENFEANQAAEMARKEHVANVREVARYVNDHVRSLAERLSPEDLVAIKSMLGMD